MVQIPIIGEVTEQKLIITFSKQENGNGQVSFNFEPDIGEAISPEQQAAVRVAEVVINAFNLNNEEQNNVNGK